MLEPKNEVVISEEYRPTLQIALDKALDLEALKRVAEVAKECFDEYGMKKGEMRIELGTPTIKKYGVDRLVPLFKREGMEILADFKVWDTGSLEAEIAFGAGADYVVVLGLAPDETIKGALEATKKYPGRKVVVDMSQCEKYHDLCKRIREVSELEVEGERGRKIHVYEIEPHVLIDKQTGIYPVDAIKEIRRIYSGQLSAAGGITREVAYQLRGVVDTVVVGGAITNEKTRKDVKNSIEGFLDALGYTKTSGSVHSPVEHEATQYI